MTTPRQQGSLWPLFLTAFTALFTFSSGNLAAPLIQRGFGADSGEVTLMLAAYTAAFAAGLILSGRLGDSIGRRRLLGAGLAALLVGSVVAAAAPLMLVLIGARIVQGAGCALAMPQILATIQVTRAPDERLKAVSMFVASNGAGTFAGQLLAAGVIEANPFGLGWRASMLVIAVMAAIAWLGLRRVAPTRSEDEQPLDVGGSVVLGASLLGLVSAVSIGPARGWPVWAIALLVAASVGLVAFRGYELRLERRGRLPLVPPRVVALRPVWLALAMAFAFFMGFGSFMFDVAQFTQTGLHLSPLASAATITSFLGTFLVASLALLRVQAVLGNRTMRYAGLLQVASLVAIAVALLAAEATGGVGGWIWWAQLPLALLGVAQAWQFGPLIGTVMAAVPAHVAGLTGGLIMTVQQASMGLGAAIVGGLFTWLVRERGWSLAFGVTIAIQAALGVVFVVLAAMLERQPPADDATA